MQRDTIPSNNITTFADFILQNKLYVDLDITTRTVLKEEIIERATMQINQKIVDSLSPTQHHEFESLAANDAPQEMIQQFIQGSLPHLHDIIVSALRDIQAYYIPQSI